MSEKNSLHRTLPLDRDNPLRFLDAVVVRLLQAQTPNQINDLLSEFLSEEAIYFMADNKQLMFVLSEVWNEITRGVVLSADDVSFPDGLLGLPPLFHYMGWIQDNPSWDPYHKKFTENFVKDPCLVNAAILLFIDGMRGDLNKALTQFNRRVEIVEENSLEEIDFTQTLEYFGWPVLVEAA